MEWTKLIYSILEAVKNWPTESPYLFFILLLFNSLLIFLHFNKEYLIDLRDKLKKQKKTEDFIFAISQDIKQVFEHLIELKKLAGENKDTSNSIETFLDTLIKLLSQFKGDSHGK
jgi:hypothetical protein